MGRKCHLKFTFLALVKRYFFNKMPLINMKASLTKDVNPFIIVVWLGYRTMPYSDFEHDRMKSHLFETSGQ